MLIKMGLGQSTILFILITAIIPFSLAEDVPLYLFYGQGCPHCSKALGSLSDLSEKYPELNVVSYEIYFNDKNRELFMHYCSELDQSVQGVPTIFIDAKTFIGFSNEIAFQIEEEIKRCLEQGCENIAEKCFIPATIGASDPIDPPEAAQNDSVDNSSKAVNNFPGCSLIGWIFLITACLVIVPIAIRKIMKKKGEEID